MKGLKKMINNAWKIPGSILCAECLSTYLSISTCSLEKYSEELMNNKEVDLYDRESLLKEGIPYVICKDDDHIDDEPVCDSCDSELELLED